MKWASVLSKKEKIDEAFSEAQCGLENALEGKTPDVVFLFVSPFYSLHFESIPQLARDAFPSAIIVGCSARGIFAGGEELEDEVGIGAIGASLPDVTVMPFHLDGAALDPRELLPSTDTMPQLVLFSDPISFDHSSFLRQLNQAEHAPHIIGGMASGAGESSYNALFLNDTLYKRGAVGIVLTGNITFEQFVAHGSKAIGDPYFATRTRDNIIYELDGRPCRLVIDSLLEELPDDEVFVFKEEGLIGIANSNDVGASLGCDMRMSQVLGLEESSGALLVDSMVPEHSIVQFHIGDPFTSHEVLEEKLKGFKAASSGKNHSGALVFSCSRRGEAFYSESGHETSVFKETFESVPLGGFFSYGELVHDEGKAKVCGLSSAYGFFRPLK